MAYRAHFDFASSAPMCPEIIEIMQKAVSEDQFDPRRLYDSAINRRYEIEESRVHVANFFDCDPSEIIFCSSSSEALATFAFGTIESPTTRFKQSGGLDSGLTFALTPYDSDIILETWMRENISIEVIPGNKDATLDIEKVKEINWGNVSVASIPFTHPDTGTLINVEDVISEIRSKNPDIYIHIDARMASGNVKLSFKDLNVDAMTVESCTWGGPIGVGILIAKIGTIIPLVPGTTQERGRRGGIENYPAIKSFGALCRDIEKTFSNEIKKSLNFYERIKSALENAGAIIIALNTNHLPNVIAAYFEGIAASVIVAEFNTRGINIHAGSSCGSEEFEPSKALAPVTGNDDISECVFRISWGYSTDEDDVVLLLSALNEIAATYIKKPQ